MTMPAPARSARPSIEADRMALMDALALMLRAWWKQRTAAAAEVGEEAPAPGHDS
jgi:hypothetical protein